MSLMSIDRISSRTGLKLASLGILALALASSPARAADPTIINASYDVSRELYKDVNEAFIADWKKKTGETPTIDQSHGGSSKQAPAVIDGLEADVVTSRSSTDVDCLAKTGVSSPPTGRSCRTTRSPYTTTSSSSCARATRRASRTGPTSPSPASR